MLSPEAGTARRVESVDVVRGLAMIAMALDHTRDFFGVPGDPTNLATASAAFFFTRWVTHFCAPTFFLLTGVGARLSRGRRSVGELSRFLLTRGAGLIVFELLVMRCFAYQFNVDFRVTMLLVLWALGWSMIALAAFVHLPVKWIVVFGALLVVGHNALDGFRATGPLWTILHGPGFVVNTEQYVVFAAYPLVPWIGVTALGYALGDLWSAAPERRRTWLWRGGLACVAAFIVLRGLNIYGNPSPWTTQVSPLYTVLAFLNTTKYPPSLLFLLMTLGPVALLLATLERHSSMQNHAPGRAWWRPLLTFGRVPLFYYAVHFFLLHLLAVIVCALRYGSVHWMFESPDLSRYPFTPPPGWGYSLPVVYVTWIIIVVAMYPLCVRYGQLKAARRGGWTSYL